jgi:hypothetical protein
MQLQFVAATMQRQRPLATPLLFLLSSNMQSLLCTALDAIELKRMKCGNQRTENGGLVRGGDSWENLGLAEVGEWV